MSVEPSGKGLWVCCVLSCGQLFVTAAHQAPLSMGFSRQEHWSGMPCLPPRDLPDPGTEHASLASPALAVRFFTIEPPGRPPEMELLCL